MVATIWAFDPGKHTGYAEMELDGTVRRKGIIHFDDIFDFIDSMPRANVVAIVFEDFRLFGHRATSQSGSILEASQVIGALRVSAKRHKIRAVAVPPGSYRTGAKFVQFKLSSGHCPDDISAWLTGAFWLKQHGSLVTALEGKLRGMQ